MPYKHQTTRQIPSTTCEGVTIVLRKMTEGRRIELRKTLASTNAEVRGILRDQAIMLAKPDGDRDDNKVMELQERFDDLMVQIVNPAYVKWGTKAIEGLEVEDQSLTVEDWEKWPSELFHEVLQAVKEESELSADKAKNSSSPTTSGDQALQKTELSNANIA